ncbi:2-octaprenyl-6-methoxyphenyl hydroxylase [Thalassotalea fusca]
MRHENYDIVIAGGGLSGLLTALSIAKQCQTTQTRQLSIAIIEPQPIKHEPNLGFDARVLALSHGTVSFLASLGCWPAIAKHAEPIKRIHISDRGYYGKARINAADHDVDALGYVVEMAIIGKALYQALQQEPNIHWYCPNTIEQIDWQQDKVALSLNDSSEKGKLTLNAQLLLGCDGAQSVCRQHANIQLRHKDYQQSALICNVQMARPHQNLAYERFTQHGPLAMLPMSDGSANSHTCSLVWTLTPEEAQTHLAQSEEAFKQALFKAFGSWLGEVKASSSRYVFPLSLVQAEESVFHRMALVGNASHTIHPIAGQGFNLGVRDVAYLSRLVVEKLKNSEDIGSFAMLNEYAQHRKQDHQRVISLTDSLVTLFSNDLPPLVAGRNIGLKILNYLPPLKSAFVNKTMGY